MSLRETLTADMKAAMKARDKETLGTVRMLLSELKNLEIDAREGLNEEDEIAFLSRQAKRRRESIAAYDEGGREELAAQERTELAVIERYLPAQMDEAEATAVIEAVIAEVGATEMKDMGRVMGQVMPRLQGRFPGKDVKPIVQRLLG